MEELRESFADIAGHLDSKQPHSLISATRQGYRCNYVVTPLGYVTCAGSEHTRAFTEIENALIVVPTKVFSWDGGKQVIMTERALPIPVHLEDIICCVIRDFKQDVTFPTYGRICSVIARNVQDDVSSQQNRYNVLYEIIYEYIQMLMEDRNVAIGYRDTVHLAWHYFFPYSYNKERGNTRRLIQLNMHHVSGIIDLED